MTEEFKFRCLKCNKPVVNRRLRKCEFCGEALPDGITFSKAERAKLDAMAAEDAQRARDRRAKERKDDDQNINDLGWIPPGEY
jgi:hypothetical protein